MYPVGTVDAFLVQAKSPRWSGERKKEMIQVVLEVCTGPASFRVTARARSIRRSISLAGVRYPGGEVRLVLPVEPESFFVGGVPGEAESVPPQVPVRLAG
jgi:hypothetical protein